MKSQSFIPLKLLVKLCPYLIKFQIYFIHGPSLVNEGHLVSATHPGDSCAVNPSPLKLAKADQS